MSTAIAKQTHGTLRTYLERDAIKAALGAALPRHMNPDRMIRVALTAAVRTPKLLECTPESIYESLLNASQLGLEPNGRDAHLIPFRDNKSGTTKCQLMPDYKGLIQLAYRSGQIDSFSAKAVYEKDRFVYRYGLNEELEHTPCTEDDPGQLVYAWAMCRFRNGGYKFVVLNRRDIKRRMAASKTASRSDSPWATHTEAMWAKSAAKELCKWIPQTPEMQQFREAVELDDQREFGESQVIDVPSEPVETKSDQLADRLAASDPNDGTSGLEPEGDFALQAEPTANRRDQYMGAIDGMDDLKLLDSMRKQVLADTTIDDGGRKTVVDAIAKRVRKLEKK
jgi:recombination protein RecT